MSMAYTAVALSVISIAATATTGYLQADNARKVGNYNKGVAENNALAAAQQGAVAASEHRQKVRQMIASQNAAYSATGVDSSTGSAAKIQEDTAGFGELDALRILNNAQNAASGMRAQGALEDWKGDAAFTSGMFNTAGETAGSASTALVGAKNAGMFGGGKK